MNVFRLGKINFLIEENRNISGDEDTIENNMGSCQYHYPDGVIDLFLESEDGEVCKRLYNSDSLTDPGLFISLVKWYNEDCYTPQDLIIKVVAQHRFWVYHDLCHAINLDVVGCDANVTASMEIMRIQEGVDLMLKHTEDDMNLQYREMVCNAFYKQYKQNLSVPYFGDWEKLWLDMYEPEDRHY